jgi:type I restriction enzyme S subunit
MEWVELRKLLEFQKKSKIKAGDGQSAGKYAMYTSSMTLDKYLDEYQYDKEALIMGTGGKANIHYSTGQFNTSTDCYVLYKKTENIVLKYIYLFLFGNIHILEEGFRGAGLKHINQKYVKEIKIPVPAMEIQEKIVEVLDVAQALIDKRKEQIELLDGLIESTFYTMFGDPVKNEKGWDVNELKNIVLINPKKSEVFNIKESNLEISFIPMKDVGEDGFLSLKETRQIKDVYSGYTYFKENDVLFAKITPCMENGKSCIARGLSNEIGFGSTEFHVIRESPLLTKEYILQLVRNNKFKKEAESMMTGSAGQKRVHGSFLENYSISIPPLPLQNEFAGKVEAIEKQKKLLEKSLELLEENYKSIMDKAFKGQLFK